MPGLLEHEARLPCAQPGGRWSKNALSQEQGRLLFGGYCSGRLVPQELLEPNAGAGTLGSVS